MKPKHIDITNEFEKLFYPKCALVLYESKGLIADAYVEHFEMDVDGNPINAHPLTIGEADRLAKALLVGQEKESAFLRPKCLLPNNILSLDVSTENGTVIWYTKAQLRELFFVQSLGIPNGRAYVPPMVWKASKHSLSVFAITGNRRPTPRTKLYHAPFFNVYTDGKVCLGSIKIDIKNSASVDEFIKAWEHYFFHSYFSHVVAAGRHMKGNCVALWKKLIADGTAFPVEVLEPNRLTINSILS